jgi:hypothetical protein
MRARIGLIPLFGLAAWACYDPNFVSGVTKCASDGACPNDWVCESGVCVDAPGNDGAGGSGSGTGGSGGSGGGSSGGGGHGGGGGGTVASGGATGKGGSAGGGGTTGSGGSTLTCLQGATYTPANSLVTDFSDATPDPSRVGQYVFGSSVGDSGWTASYASGAIGTLSLTGGVLKYTATVEAPTSSDMYPYNGFGVYFNGPGCADLSSYNGVSFTLTVSVTGTCTAVFMVTDTEHIRPADDPQRGSCAGTASQCYSSQYTVTSATAMVAFNATPTVAGMPTAAIDKSKVLGLQWEFQTPSSATASCTGSITVDNVRLY